MSIIKYKSPKEWLKQAKYDLLTAKAMLGSRRYLYCVFMSHLSIGKGLKAIVAKIYQKDPERTHNLNYLLEKIADKIPLNIPAKLDNFINYLNDKSIPTRYPEDLKIILKGYNRKKTMEILNLTNKVMRWIQTKLK